MSFAALADRMRVRTATVEPSLAPAWLRADPLAVRLLAAGLPVETVADLVQRVAIASGGRRAEPIADLLAAAHVAGCRVRWLGGWYEIDADSTATAQALAELVRQDHAEVVEHLRAGALRSFAALARTGPLARPRSRPGAFGLGQNWPYSSIRFATSGERLP
jgi:hypothetical protein